MVSTSGDNDEPRPEDEADTVDEVHPADETLSDAGKRPTAAPPSPVLTFLRKIVDFLNWQVSLSVVSALIAASAFLLQFSDSRTSTANRAQDVDAVDTAKKQRDDLISTNREIAQSTKKPNVPSLVATVSGTPEDAKIINFVDENADTVFHLKLYIASGDYQPPERYEDGNKPKWLPNDYKAHEEIGLGCSWDPDTCDMELSGALVFFDRCEGLGDCVGWYSGHWKVDGYFTVTATQVQMGQLRFVLKPVATEMVRLR